ncbi:MAG: ice-binding family protein [Xanthomonadales bacterium]|nr:ice-binding family protein [Xanthomonadales bacterium]
MKIKTIATRLPTHLAPRVFRKNTRFNRVPSGLPAGLGLAALLLISASAQAATAPDLRSTEPFAIVSATYTNTTAGTTIDGGLCYTTAPAVAPFVSGATVVPCPAVTGTDQNAARADLVSQDCTSIGAAVALNDISIGGGTPGEFPPGCYSSTGAMSITAGTTVTLTGTGVYIFRPGGTITTGANSSVVVAEGVCENDVFWAPEGATTIGANANFIGNIFRGTADGLSITFGDSSSLIGRALAFGSTVTTDNTTFVVPDPCAEPANITVNKDFIPNSTDSVPVDLSCTSGTVTTTPLNASEASPAMFTVTGADPGATCTATETVPLGYTANQGDCVGVALNGSCTITNTLNEDTIVVNKDFIPNSTDSVPVTLSCTSGTVETTPLNASEASPAVFTVTGAEPGATCTATETVPLGYTGSQLDCQDVGLGGSCEITNTLNSETIVVNKDFIPNSTETVPVTLSCTSGTVETTPLNASEALPAVFTVTGANPGATCTATETVPLGYTGNQLNCQDVGLGGSCTITNTLNEDTIVVNKDFIPNSTESVPVTLSCTSGTVETTPLNASEALPAVFTVTGAEPGATCTATETVPEGYTANQTDCVNVPLGGSCEISNTLNSDTVVVQKDFSPDSLATVPVDLVCTSGTVTTTPLSASEALPAVFTVTGADEGATCTATETVPEGYTANQLDCQDVALGGSCEITNTLNSETIVVNKDFIPNSTETVPVELSCTSGTVTTTPLDASESLPAVFTVTGAEPEATCTATETVPDGYTANQSDCVNVPLGGSCEITNTVNSETIVVNKDFIPDSTETVPVELSCTSGTVTTTPLDAAEGAPAVFTVTGAEEGATCTATETVPEGFTANQLDCAEVTPGGSCTISNSLDSDTITVNKDFSPNSTESVPVTLSCTSGTVETTPLSAAEGAPAVFTVTGADEGTTCTATETVPDGYTANQANCVDVLLGGACMITNTLNEDTIVVNKDFIPNSTEPVPVTLSCTSGTVETTPLNAAEGAPAVFTVTGAEPETTCTATETVPIGYTGNELDCLDVPLGGSCQIINTLNEDTIVVNKDFIPNSTDSVPVTLSCTSGTVETTPLNAAEGAPAVFTVTGAEPGATCTATETVPTGYMGNQLDCVDVALGGSCEITNTLNSDTVVVQKDFSPDSLATVPVDLVCTSGTVTTTPLNASEAQPAVFTVTGADEGATCTATETVPTGYTGNQLDCVDVALGSGCEIINTLNSETIVVEKDFSPNSTATVSVALTCTSGTVENTPLLAAEGAPAVFTVTEAEEGATCTATETVPGGYTANQASCVDVPLGGSCQITNTLNSDTIVVEKDFSPNSTAAVSVALTCTSGTVEDTPLLAAEGAPAVFTVTEADEVTTCTATETVPDGYTVNQADCENVPLGGSCEIINILENPSDRASFRVIKDFTDGNPMDVEVTLSCSTGLPLTQSANINESNEVEFIVTTFEEGELNCDIVEVLPSGYSPTYTAGATTGTGLVSDDLEGCHFDEVVSGQFVCLIVNEPDLVDIKIEKLLVIDGAGAEEADTRYSLRLFCDEPIGLAEVFEGEGSETFFAQVAPQYPSTRCWVLEMVFSSGVEVDNGCNDLEISAAQGGDSCLITNTVFFEGIPTLSHYGLAILLLLTLGLGLVGVRRLV